MKKIDVTFGCNYTPIKNGSRPSTYRFFADAWINICGGFGIPSAGDCKSRTISVLVPDWIVPSRKRSWHIAVANTRSNSGSDDLAFVVCNERPTQDVAMFGSCDQYALIDKAIASGLKLIYPTKDGSMATMPVSVAKEDE